MSNLEKTGKKLIDSMRMTKEGSATAAVQSATGKTTTPRATKPETAAATTKARPAKVKATSTASSKASKKPVSSAANRNNQPRNKTIPLAGIPYQDGSQVWPD